jgi:uncharacterized protein YceK
MRNIISVLLALCLAGCFSMRPLAAPIEGRTVAASVKVGQSVRVLTRSQRILELKVTAVEPEALFGRTDQGEGKLYKVPYAAIESLEVRRFSGGKTTGAISVGAIASYVAVVLLAGYAIGHALDDAFGDD